MVSEIHVAVIKSDDNSPLSGSCILRCFLITDVYDPTSRIYCWYTKSTRKSIRATLKTLRNALESGIAQVVFREGVKQRILECMPDADFGGIDHLVNKPLPLYVLARNVVIDNFSREIESGQIYLPEIIRNDVREPRCLHFPRSHSLSTDYISAL